MYLVAVTRDPLTDDHIRFGGHPVHRMRLGSRVLTVVTDGKFSAFTERTDEFRIIDTLEQITESKPRLIRSTVILCRQSATITMSMVPDAVGAGYYVIDDDGDLFCSTRISLLRDAGVPIDENPGVLPELFTYAYVAPPNTLYRNIKRLWLGCRIVFEVRSGGYEVTSRTLPKPTPVERLEAVASSDQAADRTLEALTAHVRTLDYPVQQVAVPLSGGLDSSILWALCHRELGVTHAYSTSYPFENPRENIEKEYASTAANAFGATHVHYETTNREFLGSIVDAIHSAEEPIHMAAALLGLQYAHGVPPETRFVVSGGGADVDQGKRFHQKVHLAKKSPWTRWAMTRPVLGRRVAKILGAASIRTKGLDLINGTTCPADDPSHVAWLFDKCGSDDWVRAYFGALPDPTAQGRYELLSQLGGYSAMDLVALTGLFENVTVAQGIWATLAESRGRGMAFPFLSEAVMDTAFSVSWKDKLEPPKNILRRVARLLDVPEFIVTRKKTGLGSAPALWAVEGGVLEPLLVLCDGIFDLELIRRLQKHPNSRNSTVFWCILNYSIWKRLFVDTEPVGALLERVDAAYGRLAGRN